MNDSQPIARDAPEKRNSRSPGSGVQGLRLAQSGGRRHGEAPQPHGRGLIVQQQGTGEFRSWGMISDFVPGGLRGWQTSPSGSFGEADGSACEPLLRPAPGVRDCPLAQGFFLGGLLRNLPAPFGGVCVSVWFCVVLESLIRFLRLLFVENLGYMDPRDLRGRKRVAALRSP